MLSTSEMLRQLRESFAQRQSLRLKELGDFAEDAKIADQKLQALRAKILEQQAAPAIQEKIAPLISGYKETSQALMESIRKAMKLPQADAKSIEAQLKESVQALNSEFEEKLLRVEKENAGLRESHQQALDLERQIIELMDSQVEVLRDSVLALREFRVDQLKFLLDAAEESGIDEERKIALKAKLSEARREQDVFASVEAQASLTDQREHLRELKARYLKLLTVMAQTEREENIDVGRTVGKALSDARLEPAFESPMRPSNGLAAEHKVRDVVLEELERYRLHEQERMLARLEQAAANLAAKDRELREAEAKAKEIEDDLAADYDALTAQYETQQRALNMEKEAREKAERSVADLTVRLEDTREQLSQWMSFSRQPTPMTAFGGISPIRAQQTRTRRDSREVTPLAERGRADRENLGNLGGRLSFSGAKPSPEKIFK